MVCHGRHTVEYVGTPDGERCIGGEWTVSAEHFGQPVSSRGPLLLRPELPEPVQEQ